MEDRGRRIEDREWISRLLGPRLCLGPHCREALLRLLLGLQLKSHPLIGDQRFQFSVPNSVWDRTAAKLCFATSWAYN